MDSLHFLFQKSSCQFFSFLISRLTFFKLTENCKELLLLWAISVFIIWECFKIIFINSFKNELTTCWQIKFCEKIKINKSTLLFCFCFTLLQISLISGLTKDSYYILMLLHTICCDITHHIIFVKVSWAFMKEWE